MSALPVDEGYEAAIKPGSQKAKLLLVYADQPGKALNWSQVLARTDINPRACAWKRVGELAEDGLLEVVKINGIVLAMPGDMGSEQRCYVITEKGMRKAKELRQ